MKCHRSKKLLIDKIRKGNDDGFILVVALVLLVTLTLVGTTASIITSTDIKIGGNFRESQEALQVAMAGAEHGREVLRALNEASADKESFSDELAARVGGNAALEGYVGDDVPLVSSAIGDFTYDVFLTNDLAEGSTIQADNNNRVHITSVAKDSTNAFNASARIEIEVDYVSVPVVSPLYAKDNVTLNGNAMSVNGNDRCGALAALPPIYNFSIPGDVSVTILNGGSDTEPDPPGPIQGPLDIDILSYVNSLENVAVIILKQDQNNTDFGSSTDYVAVYSDTSNPPNTGGLMIQNGTGYGLLAVDGDLTLGGGFNWYGLILVNGTLTLNGGAGPNQTTIYGAILAHETVGLNGDVDIFYDSCEVANALLSTGLPVVSWKQNY